MKLTFDTADTDIREDADTLGTLLNLFIARNGGHPYFGRKDDGKAGGWTVCSNTPRELLVALMGDGVYDDMFTATHLRHDATDLQVLWYADGDLVLMYHMAADDDATGAGFTIVNSHHGLGDNWRFEDLIDARNDPKHDPWADNPSMSRVAKPSVTH